MEFVEAFEKYLHENQNHTIDDEFERIVITIREANNDIDFNMNILNEIMAVQAEYEQLNESIGIPTVPPTEGGKSGEEESRKQGNNNRAQENNYQRNADRKIEDDIQKKIDEIMKKIASRAVPSLNSTYNDDRPGINYTPEAGLVVTKTLSDMKFPENIKFFIETIIKWLVNLVKFVLKAIKNLIKIITGESGDKDEMRKAAEALRLNFKKSRVYQTVGTPIVGKVKGNVDVRMMDPSEVVKVGIFSESCILHEDKAIAISLDVSKDVLSLKEFANHFFKLYDNAFGSNEEYLFGTEDVELLLKAFNTVRQNLESGRLTHYSINGRLAELDMIDADRIRDAVYKTKVNTDALTSAYSQTFAKIQDIIKVIQSKSLMQSVDSVVSFKILSHATSGAALDLLEAVSPRIKEAVVLEKRLAKVQNMYEKLIKELQKNVGIIGAFGKVTYVSEYQNQISNLFNSARYTSQMISMRISALALYLKYLKDMKEMLKLLSKFNDK
jgi:hypothetical protein